MIRSFRHAGLEKFFTTGSKAGIQPAHAKKLSEQLFTLNRASVPIHMDFPGWRLHQLQGELAGHWSVRVNGNWRMTFRFEGEDRDPGGLPRLPLKGAETMRMYNPPHPGTIIKDGLENIPISVTAFAKHIGVSRVALSRVLNGRARITPEMSLKISEALGQGSSDIWFKLQGDYDSWHASRAKRKKVRPIKMKMAKAA